MQTVYVLINRNGGINDHREWLKLTISPPHLAASVLSFITHLNGSVYIRKKRKRFLLINVMRNSDL